MAPVGEAAHPAARHARVQRCLLLAVALWLPPLLLGAFEIVFEAELLRSLGTQGLAWASAVCNALAAALVCAWFARRRPDAAWPVLGAGLSIAYLTALGLALLLDIELKAARVVLIVDLMTWLAAAVLGTALGLRMRPVPQSGQGRAGC